MASFICTANVNNNNSSSGITSSLSAAGARAYNPVDNRWVVRYSDDSFHRYNLESIANQWSFLSLVSLSILNVKYFLLFYYLWFHLIFWNIDSSISILLGSINILHLICWAMLFMSSLKIIQRLIFFCLQDLSGHTITYVCSHQTWRN